MLPVKVPNKLDSLTLSYQVRIHGRTFYIPISIFQPCQMSAGNRPSMKMNWKFTGWRGRPGLTWIRVTYCLSILQFDSRDNQIWSSLFSIVGVKSRARAPSWFKFLKVRHNVLAPPHCFLFVHTGSQSAFSCSKFGRLKPNTSRSSQGEPGTAPGMQWPKWRSSQVPQLWFPGRWSSSWNIPESLFEENYEKDLNV